MFGWKGWTQGLDLNNHLVHFPCLHRYFPFELQFFSLMKKPPVPTQRDELHDMNENPFRHMKWLQHAMSIKLRNQAGWVSKLHPHLQLHLEPLLLLIWSLLSLLQFVHSIWEPSQLFKTLGFFFFFGYPVTCKVRVLQTSVLCRGLAL